MSANHTGASTGPSRHVPHAHRQQPSLYRLVRPARINPSSQPRRILGEIEWWRVVSGQEPEPTFEPGFLHVDAFVHQPSSPPLSPTTPSTPTNEDRDDARPPSSPPQSPSDAQTFDFATTH
ncbi:hypothetical protein EXIGLDRAFT_837192 [Exidia glandulosa HHB12029]|uniref:Uncharacterized protein n=1 Tax=Exidia glandulosa HHB12029 TaxID=1314781 RepID=A0A165H2L5_EXIGL|nr:hypothetical protein EXIGLDRAFT_837192 [Exidia glandulosa HHB12029]